MSERNFEGNGIVSVEAEPYSAVFWQDVCIYQFLHDAYYLQGGFKNIQGSYVTGDSTALFYQTMNKLSHPRAWFSLFIDCQYEPLFTEQPPTPIDVDPIVEPLIENINRAGMTADEYKMNLLMNGISAGAAFMAHGSDGVEGSLPYYFYYTADQYNKELTEVDQYGAVQVYVMTTQIDKHKYRHDVYTDTEVRQYQSGDHDKLGELATGEDGEPMITSVKSQVIEGLYSQRKEQLKVLPYPKSSNIAELCLGLYEQETEYRWTLHKQTNDLLVIRGDGVNGVINPTDSAINLDADSPGAGAEFISPSKDNPVNQLAGCEKTRSDLFEFMHQAGVVVQSSSQEGESGYSKSFSFKTVDTTMAKARKMSKKVDAYIQRTLSETYARDIAWEFKYKTSFISKGELTMLDLKDAYELFSIAAIEDGKKAVLKQAALHVDEDDSDLVETIENAQLGTTE